jgi:hypothetical protein
MSLHWNYKDVFRACRLSFSAKKIWMQMVGLIFGGVGYSLLTYLAYWASGANLSDVWARFTLIPFLDGYYMEAAPIQWWSWVIYALATIWFVVCCLVAGAAVAKVTIEQLRGDDFFEMKEAFKYALSRIGSILGTPLMPLLFAAFLVVCGLILGLLGGIPEVGPILVGIFAIPAFGASLFVVYLLVVFVAALTLVPAIVGSTKNDAFDTLFEVFSCTNEQTWRFAWYSILLELLALFGTAILGWFALQAIRLGSGVLGVFMGDKLPAIASGGTYYLHFTLPSWLPFYHLITNSGMVFGGPENLLTAVTVGQNIGALLVGIAAYVVMLFVLGYSWAIWNVGQTLVFCVLVKKKDDKNLLTEKETEDLLSEETDATTAASNSGPGPAVATPSAGCPPTQSP